MTFRHDATDNHLLHDELSEKHDDPLIRSMHRIIRRAVRVLAVLMVLVIILAVGDVVYVLYQQLNSPPLLLLNLSDIFRTFGAFMAVLIAIEIFINIRLYLGSNQFPVQLVVATALMAIARKVIILDFEKVTPDYILSIAAVVLALGITHWLLAQNRLAEMYGQRTRFRRRAGRSTQEGTGAADCSRGSTT